MPVKTKERPSTDAGSKTTRILQTDFPAITLERALRIAQALWDNYAGGSTAPHDVALAIDLAPTSGTWRELAGASIAYGLSDGGYRANEMQLADLGRRIVAPTELGDDLRAKREAILRPRIMGEFFRKYDRAKFPADHIAENVLVSMGLPKKKAAESVKILRANGEYTGILRTTKTGLYVALDALPPSASNGALAAEPDLASVDSEEMLEDQIARNVAGPPLPGQVSTTAQAENNRVFISHGKNRAIVDQLKELLTFGKFEAVVSVEKETASIPVPDKVFSDMRDCAAAVIHVSSEGEVMDPDGNRHVRLNENVLIEIGAAIALYGKKFVLLVQKGVKLPSNLQGLYLCEYEGEKLDYDATMKLLKIFSSFR